MPRQIISAIAILFFGLTVRAEFIIGSDTPLLKSKGNFKGADCTETAMSAEQFSDLATSPNVNNIVDLLKALPKDSFETYTYVTNSLSAQKGTGDTGVSEKWPRVIRTNKDGSITFSWTCNPNSETYNSIEMLYVKDGELQGRSFRLDKPSGTSGANGRINPSPTSCVSCHSTGVPVGGKLSMKHNWPEYFTWSDCKDKRGIKMYGGNDDNMKPGEYRSRSPSTEKKPGQDCYEDSNLDRQSVMAEQKSFQEFKEMQKDNPCYNLLPHPEDDTVVEGLSYKYYPYSERAQKKNAQGIMDYSLRVNLKITDMYAHHNANRISQILKNSPHYEEIKYFLAMDAAGCLKPEDDETIHKIVPGLKAKTGDESWVENKMNPRKNTPLIYNYGEKAGLRPADWSLEFNPNTNHDDPVYRAGIASSRGRDLGIPDLTGGNILKDIAASDPVIAEAAKNVFDGGVAKTFGARFSCIDDLGKGILVTAKGAEGNLCKALRARNEQVVKDCLERRNICSSPSDSLEPKEQATNVLSVVDKMREEFKKTANAELTESIARGKELVQNPKGAAHCINCHSRTPENLSQSPSDFLFIPSDSISPAERAISSKTLKRMADIGSFNYIEDYVNQGNMPFDGKLEPQQKKDVINYIKSLVVE